MSKANERAYLFEGIFAKPVHARFDAEQRTSDGGLALLAAVDRRVGLTSALAACVGDRRDQSRVMHSVEELLRQRVYSIALGYPDANDAAQLAGDPALLMALGRRCRLDGLASQPTLSRFEHGVQARDLVAMQRRLEDVAIARLRKRHRSARRIFIDLDPSVDPTHGQQPFAFFNGHYDTWCYLPMLGFLSVEGDAEQYLFHARLRAGLAKEVKGTLPLLTRTVESLRRTFPKARICIRLDAGFAHPKLFDLLDDLRVEYVVAVPTNVKLVRLCDDHMAAAESLAATFDATATLFGDGPYRARSWQRARRVVFKAEVVVAAGKTSRRNDRYVVTNLRGSAERVWRLYCQRGDSENRIKELKNDLAIDRTSCTRFLPNALRVLMTAAAYVLFQELRATLAGTELRRAMVATLRLRLMKIGATVTESVRRIVISMPSSFPWKDLWRRAARAVACMA